jgi:hypothetical protein
MKRKPQTTHDEASPRGGDGQWMILSPLSSMRLYAEIC